MSITAAAQPKSRKVAKPRRLAASGRPGKMSRSVRRCSDGPCQPPAMAWAVKRLGDAKVYGDAMSSYVLRHHDRVRLDHDLAPSDSDIVLAKLHGVGRVLHKLPIIGGIHVLSADAGVKPILVEDLLPARLLRRRGGEARAATLALTSAPSSCRNGASVPRARRSF